MNQPTDVTYPNCHDCKWCAKKTKMCLGFEKYPERAALLGESSAIFFWCARSVIVLCGVPGNWFEPKTPGEVSPGESYDMVIERAHPEYGGAGGFAAALLKLDPHGNKGQPV